MKEVKGLAKKHICRTHGHSHQCGAGLREEGGGNWVEVSKAGGAEKGDLYNRVMNKNKGKKENLTGPRKK